MASRRTKTPLDNIRYNDYGGFVPGKLAAEIQQTKPFALLEEEAALNIMRTAEVLGKASASFFRDYDLSATQYNVLRILRGAEPSGATCSQIAERMINHDPDITRLLDRLESRGFISRDRIKTDRRVVMARIAPAGLDLVSRIDRPLRAFLKARLGKLDPPGLTSLIGQLEQIREFFQIEQEKL
jgi:DNA-binding MarR family transcriptional regulator